MDNGVDAARDKFSDALFLPVNAQRRGEGGLRTAGVFKKSEQGSPLLTVITVTLNRASCLDKTLASILQQTYNNVEVIVIDGGAEDETLDVLRKYEKSIDYWVSEPDTGIYQAMNKGVVLARGEWLNFMNAGDFFYDRESLNFLMGGPIAANDRDVVYGNAAIRSHDEHLVESKITPVEKQAKCKLRRFYHQSMLIKRAAFLRQGLYDESFFIGGDANWLNRLYVANQGKGFFYVDKIISIFDFTEGASHGLKNFFRMRKEDRITLKQVIGKSFVAQTIFFAETWAYFFQRVVAFLLRRTIFYKLFRKLMYRKRYVEEVWAPGKGRSEAGR